MAHAHGAGAVLELEAHHSEVRLMLASISCFMVGGGEMVETDP